MNTREFLKVLKQYAKKEGLSFDVDKNRGKGSHCIVHLGPNQSTVPMDDDVPLGTLRNVLKRLGVDPGILRK